MYFFIFSLKVIKVIILLLGINFLLDINFKVIIF